MIRFAAPPGYAMTVTGVPTTQCPQTPVVAADTERSSTASERQRRLGRW